MRRLWIIVLAITLAVALTAAPASAKKKHHPAPTTTTVPVPIFTQAGTGTATTRTFKVPNDWNLAWTYDCSQFFGGRGNFMVQSYDYYKAGSQLDFDNTAVNQLGATGAGVEHYHSGGNTKYLEVNSECAWTVTVTRK